MACLHGLFVIRRNNRMKSYKTMHDNIHGYMKLPIELFKFIDTVYFQRLRLIKQCGFVSYVFPNSNQTRFEHSIGVAYLAGLLVTNLKNVQPELNISDRDILCVQIAALLHDIGHGPFSHTYELISPEFSHEKMSCTILRSIIKEKNLSFSEEEIAFIEKCIGKEPVDDDKSSRYFLYQIVSNKDSGLDVDKLDYFMRDSKNAGTSINLGTKRILEECRVHNYEGRNVLSFPIKMKNEILIFFQTRYYLHTTIYQHKVVNAIEYMFLDALRIANNNNVFGFDVIHAWNDLDKFITLNDSIFSKIIDSSCHEAKDLCLRILNRDLYKCILESSHRPENPLKESEILVSKDIHWGLQDKNPLDYVLFHNNGRVFILNKDEYDCPTFFKKTIYRIYNK